MKIYRRQEAAATAIMQGAAVFIFGGCLRPGLHCAVWQDGNVRYTHSCACGYAVAFSMQIAVLSGKIRNVRYTHPCASNVKSIENDDFRVFFDTFRVFAVDSASKQGDPNVRKYRK